MRCEENYMSTLFFPPKLKSFSSECKVSRRKANHLRENTKALTYNFSSHLIFSFRCPVSKTFSRIIHQKIVIIYTLSCCYNPVWLSFFWNIIHIFKNDFFFVHTMTINGDQCFLWIPLTFIVQTNNCWMAREWVNSDCI